MESFCFQNGQKLNIFVYMKGSELMGIEKEKQLTSQISSTTTKKVQTSNFSVKFTLEIQRFSVSALRWLLKLLKCRYTEHYTL